MMSVKTANVKVSLVKHRRTYHIQDELHEKVKAYAYWERVSISEVVNAALKQFLNGWNHKDARKDHKDTFIKIEV